MNRRNALKSGLVIATAANFLPLVKASDPRENEAASIGGNNYTCLVKKGHPRTDGIFAYCFMNVDNLSDVRRDIDTIFQNQSYKTEFKYSSNDRYKIEVANAIIDYVINSRYFSFHVNIFISNPKSFKELNPTAYDSKINGLYKSINFNKMSSQAIIMKAEDNYGPSQKVKNNFSNQFGKTSDFIIANEDRLIQVNDFIAGSILAVKSGKEVESSTKKLLNQSFKNSTGLESSLSSESKKNIAIKIENL